MISRPLRLTLGTRAPFTRRIAFRRNLHRYSRVPMVERTGLPSPLYQCRVKGSVLSVLLTPWRLLRKLRAQYMHMAWADYSRAPIAEKAGLTLDSQAV